MRRRRNADNSPGARKKRKSRARLPREGTSQKASIIIDLVTGLPVLSAGQNAPQLTSKQVRDILSEFP